MYEILVTCKEISQNKIEIFYQFHPQRPGDFTAGDVFRTRAIKKGHPIGALLKRAMRAIIRY
jgi:hypothetical protein